ncbi:unnamed protein product [Durusdinium trenchii]|uniref:Mitochondrial n=2 Tax=Durusdinium trenchii TaxID=1381693 RepID=A0ABP0KHP3_9DINO
MVWSRVPLNNLARGTRRCGIIRGKLHHAGLGAGRRHVRTGFFPEENDPFFIDPEGPLLSEPLNARWRAMDDPTLRSGILERNNVGMGMVVMNRAEGFDLPSINDLYQRLRNLEVNSLKRFVGLAAMEPGPFSVGLDPKELLLAAVMANKKGALPDFSKALLWNFQELAHLVADYRKPLISHISGYAQDGGGALACLAPFSGAWEDSTLCVRACHQGLVPMGGMTYVLGSLPAELSSLGEFLALTGWELEGADLVSLDLVEHWLSPEALPFLELTAEKHLEVSEADSRLLLREHSLPLPLEGDLHVKEAGKEGRGFQRRYFPLIHRFFKEESPKAIQDAIDKEIANLENIKSEKMQTELRFLKDCRDRMKKVSTRAAWITLELIRKVRRGIREARATASKQRVHPEVLVEALRAELWAQHGLLKREETIWRLHQACTGTETKEPTTKEAPTTQQVSQFTNPPEDFFTVFERPEMPLSQHPRLRRYHPDFDAATGLDHDPAWMQQEARRWNPNLLEKERQKAVKELLGNEDPSKFGQSRWVRVEPE